MNLLFPSMERAEFKGFEVTSLEESSIASVKKTLSKKKLKELTLFFPSFLHVLGSRANEVLCRMDDYNEVEVAGQTGRNHTES